MLTGLGETNARLDAWLRAGLALLGLLHEPDSGSGPRLRSNRAQGTSPTEQQVHAPEV